MSDGVGDYWVIEVAQPIVVWGVDPTAETAYEAVSQEGSVPVSPHVPARGGAPLRCPQCDADRGWTAMGAWDDPVRLVCPAGHGWTPWGDQPARGRELMQELILASGIEAYRA
ncbi:hypothetical protein [Streptomyces pinistramenti]|uniref:hypothetical protein n=1 Tax=Streptomyces pinistramenti TaxID=2884812 RepID=UPI001D077E03|nr:hypothetical protein [Streptomyces pinistramenti]MCB5910044.1 hypothetical protein [Streptomyces pinistramenti]